MAESPADAKSLYEWQQTRRRPDGVFAVPIRGFGDGRLTLWVPPEKPTEIWEFVDGEAVLKSVADDVDPVAERLRMDILLGSNNPELGIVTVTPAFLKYAAHILKRNYTLSDADLSYALLQSPAWRKETLIHAIGGMAMVESLEAAAEAREGLPEMLREARGTLYAERAVKAASEVLRNPETREDSSGSPRRRSWLARLFRPGVANG